MNQRLAMIIFAFAIVVAVVAGFFSPERDEPPPAAGLIRDRLKSKEGLKKPQEPSPRATSPRSSSVSPSRKGSSRALRSLAGEGGRSMSAERFSRKYGEELRFSREGDRVVRIDGSGVKRSEIRRENKSEGFSPARESDLAGRASEILRDARAILGFDEGVEFLAPLLSPGRSSGSVFFQQSIDGVPVYPGGVVTVSIGPEGELRRLDSSAFPDVRIENRVAIEQPQDSRLVLYVTQTQPEPVLRYSFVTQARGVESVRDAETGSVLFERDRRVYK